MSNAPQLQPVLDRIDADFNNSLERLFALLRIKSISADPAFAGDCKAAADHLAKDIATLGFETEVRPTAGHPAIIAKTNGGGNGHGRPHVLFYGHYDVQPVDPLNLWHRPPFEPAVTDHADGRKIIVARGAEGARRGAQGERKRRGRPGGGGEKRKWAFVFAPRPPGGFKIL